MTKEIEKKGTFKGYAYRLWEKNGKKRVYFDEMPVRKTGTKFFYDFETGISARKTSCKEFNEDLAACQEFAKNNF